MKLREAAYGLLTTKDRIRHDPNLQTSKGQHGKPRNDFCRKNVTKLLSDKNPYTRKFAHDLLKTYFRAHKDDPVVLDYDWKDGSRTKWRKVANYWNKVLKR